MLLHPSFPASDLLNDRAAGTDPRSEHLLRLSVFMKSESYNCSEGMKDKIGGEERDEDLGPGEQSRREQTLHSGEGKRENR